MAATRGLDGVLVFSWRRRAVTWFTGYFPGFRTNFACLWVPSRGEPRLGIRFSFDRSRAEAASGLEARGVEDPLAILPRSAGRIGIVGGDFAVDETPLRLTRRLDRRGVNLSDLRPEVDSWRARKTASDVEGIRHATTVVADAIASAFANAPRRSEMDFALAARVEAHAREREAEECLCLVGVGADAVVTEPTGCGIESGDSIAVEVTAIVAGYCTQVCMTRPAGISIRAQQACAIARTALVDRMKSGASVAEVVSEGDSALQREGFREAKLYDLGHGVGCDIPELPRLLPSTAGVLEEGMVIVAHVGVGDPRLGAAFIGSPVVIGPAGAVELAGEPVGVI